MPVYRIELNLKSPLGTDLLSGTIWGHLAWAIRYLEGESSFLEWLEDQESQPWLVSSQMPVGVLPRPVLKPALRTASPSTLEQMSLDKAVRKQQFISESLFVRLRDAMSDEKLNSALQEDVIKSRETKGVAGEEVRAHNTIDRLTGTTPQTGGLFFEQVAIPHEEARCQLFLSAAESCLERLQVLFAFVGENGFGCNASTGNGHFDAAISEETVLFAPIGNRAMSLSHGVLSRNMTDARFKQHVHFGKLGGDYAKGRYSPFKYPILMARPGTTFTPSDNGPFGALLRGVHHDEDLSGLRHHALHLPLRFSEVTS